MAKKSNGIDKDTLLTIGAIVAGGYVLYEFRGLLKDAFRVVTDAPPAELQEYVRDKYINFVDRIKALNINQGNLSKPRIFYKQAAETLYNAMNGPGTAKGVIFDTVQGLNKDDLKTIYMDFGLRAPTINVLYMTYATGPRQDLISWFIDDLRGRDLQRMFDIWKGTGLVPPK